MPAQLSVHFLPALVPEEALAGASVVVIDVLRASTTITHALEAGAERVLPCVDIDEARRVASALPVGTVVLGGERGGLPIEGFHFGNSPREFCSEHVRGKTVVFTTTNGTRAMAKARFAREVLVGSFVNAAAIVRRLLSAPQMHLLCAGSGGEITREDVLAAGLMVARLIGNAEGDLELQNDEARLAREVWLQAAGARTSDWQSASPVAASLANTAWLEDLLRDSKGGRNLARIGLAADIADAARLDRFELVPVLDLAQGAITAI
ncbi:MAG: 2-phosphosulfolactate phosphatase [Pirellulales bacterium]|nr:2-phosphosulfolactate phosphatase [Pirellulales bacterium]